jgi:hypothetical protein
MRSIRAARAILGDALLGAFARSLVAEDLSPVTGRGYRHDLDRIRAWLEEKRGARGGMVPVAGITAVDLINYRQHLVHAERLQATTINRKIQALKKLFRWASGAGHVKTDVLAELRFLPLGRRDWARLKCRRYYAPLAKLGTVWPSAITRWLRCWWKPGCGWARFASCARET